MVTIGLSVYGAINLAPSQGSAAVIGLGGEAARKSPFGSNTLFVISFSFFFFFFSFSLPPSSPVSPCFTLLTAHRHQELPDPALAVRPGAVPLRRPSARPSVRRAGAALHSGCSGQIQSVQLEKYMCREVKEGPLKMGQACTVQPDFEKVWRLYET
ncbi:uncharacterized protein LJ206_018212 [Theristicus caerulescens]